MYWKIFGLGMLFIYVVQIVSLFLGLLNSFTFKREGLELVTGKVIWLDFFMGMGFVFGMAIVGIGFLVR